MQPIKPACKTPSYTTTQETSKILEDLLENVFCRGYTKLNDSLKKELERASENIYEYYLKKLYGEEIDSVEQYRKFPGHPFKSYPYHIDVVSFPHPINLKDSEGLLLIDIRKSNKQPFTKLEKIILDNFPIQLSHRSSSGIEISQTLPAIFQIDETGNSVAQISFKFDIENGEASVVEGIDTIEEYTRIVNLSIRSPLIP